MLYKIFLILSLLASLTGMASHLRSGEISYVPVPGMPNTFDITITVYTNVGIQSSGFPTPDLPSLLPGSVSFGDTNTPYNAYITRTYGILITPSIRKNLFIIRHTYPNSGNYIISLTEAARDYGIQNIPNSDQRTLYVESMLTTGYGITRMSSPVLSFPPIGDGCLNYRYKLNPGALDPDGDLLKFALVRCKQTNGVDIPGYQFPDEMVPGTTFVMDPKTGIIIWNKPTIQGEYNVAFRIEKWRNNVLIGYVVRDMQITIGPCVNNPPIIDPVPDICVPIGTIISYKVTAHDPDNDSLTFETTGTPFEVQNNPAQFTQDVTPGSSISGTFKWATLPGHLSKNAYQVNYRVSDWHDGAPSLQDFISNTITLITPSVKNVIATPNQDLHGFNIKWDPYIMPQATGFNIYRKQGPSTFQFDSCTLGIPVSSGFKLAGTVNGLNTLSFTDSNNRNGLASGYTYCYVVTAVFEGGAESLPSVPYCNSLMIPFISVKQDTLNQCIGNTVIIDSTIVKFFGTDTLTRYNWTVPNALKLNFPGFQTPSVTIPSPGIYPVKIVSHNGVYVDSATIYFKVRPIPSPLIKLVDLGGIPDSVMFYNRSDYDVSANWLFPDGTRSTKMDSVLYIFQKNGYYRTYLTVYNSLGCPDTTSVLHRVTMKGLAVPNAFEPENTSTELNTFRPKALGLKSFYMGIWDLWGNLIWSSTELDQNSEPAYGWDGKDKKGRKMPSQNYIWRMSATFSDGSVWKGVKDHFGHYHKEGTVSLLR